MNVFFISLLCISCFIWIILVFKKPRFYKYREIFVPYNDQDDKISNKFPSISVIIPARNEEDVLAKTLLSMVSQKYPNFEIILVNDQSTDKTKKIAEDIKNNTKNNLLKIIDTKKLPEGWVGKLWALQHGVEIALGDWILFTDADIEHPKFSLYSLISHACEEKLDFFSLMAKLQAKSFWEKLLIPAFLYFFKLMYPFASVNMPDKKIAAAAGGCILFKKKALEEIGGLNSIKDEVIDDIAFAKAIKGKGYKIKLMDGPDFISKRSYNKLGQLWKMVTRTAFTELNYSYLKLLGCVLIMSIIFIAPLTGLLSPLYFNCTLFPLSIAILTMFLISFTYFETIIYFKISFIFLVSLPAAAILYILMTIDSSILYFFGIRSRWKNREYFYK